MKYDPQRPAEPVSEDELHALVDGRLDDAQRRALEARLDGDPRAAATRAAWQRQRDALRALHRPLLDEAVPPSLSAAAERVAAVRRSVDTGWRWGGLAAGVACAFALGWTVRGLESPPGRHAPVVAAAGQAGGVREFVHQASIAHQVYVPELRHPVEVTAAEQQHLVQWLSKRLDRPLRVPDLQPLGYALVGGRLLPGGDGARAQFMYQHSDGGRVTLYLGAVSAQAAAPDGGNGATPNPRESAFRYSTDGPVPGFYWVDQGFGYALAGALPRERLMELARAVYRQL